MRPASRMMSYTCEPAAARMAVHVPTQRKSELLVRALIWYSIYLAASPLGTRLGTLFAKNVKREQIPERLRPIIECYKNDRRPEERFGDFCHRVGIAALQEAATCAAA